MSKSTRSVECVKLGITAEGLERPPFPGPVGQRIFESVSREAWRLWLSRQTLLINEYRLDLLDPKARSFLQEAAVSFLWSQDADPPAPPGFRPPASHDSES